jgi:predicted RNase H-like nuclease (RuvC/YqgF family)
MASNTKLKEKALNGFSQGHLSKNVDLVNIPSENTSLTANNRTSTTAAEIEKWKKFGYLMAESYDELKKENEKLKQERDKDRKIMHALKDQVDKLKLIIKAKTVDENIDSSERRREHQEKDKLIETMRDQMCDKDKLIEALQEEIQ